jgi:hypothetical protein
MSCCTFFGCLINLFVFDISKFLWLVTYPEEGSTKILRNLRKYLPVDMTLESSVAQLWKAQNYQLAVQ